MELNLAVLALSIVVAFVIGLFVGRWISRGLPLGTEDLKRGKIYLKCLNPNLCLVRQEGSNVERACFVRDGYPSRFMIIETKDGKEEVVSVSNPSDEKD